MFCKPVTHELVTLRIWVEIVIKEMSAFFAQQIEAGISPEAVAATDRAQPLLFAVQHGIVAALAGVAYFIKWQGESFAAGLLSGIALFCGWYRLEKGRWP